MIYVDTSVLAALYWPEALSAQAERSIQGVDHPAISELVEVEFVSALARRIREKHLSREDGARVTAAFSSHIEAGAYTRLAMESAHYRLARDWIAQFAQPLRTLDALHLAVASLANLTLLTADQALVASARALGVRTTLLKHE